jgi:hypothetical protein
MPEAGVTGECDECGPQESHFVPIWQTFILAHESQNGVSNSQEFSSEVTSGVAEYKQLTFLIITQIAQGKLH